MKHIKLYEEFVNESDNKHWEYHFLENGIVEISTLKYHEAVAIVKKLKDSGFNVEAQQVRGIYFDGFVHIKPPKLHDEIVKLFKIIEDYLGSDIGSNGNRPSKTGKL
jgi:hypothetical protein